MKKQFSFSAYLQQNWPSRNRLQRLFLTLICLISFSIIYGQTAPDFRVTARPCEKAFEITVPIWYCNNQGDDGNLKKLEIILDDGASKITVWKGELVNADNSAEENKNNIHIDTEADCWDDESVKETFPHSSIKRIGNGSTNAVNPESTDTWFEHTQKFGPIPNDWYGKQITVEVKGSFEDLPTNAYSQSKTINYASLPTVTGLKQETGDKSCNTIKLSWTKPNAPFTCTSDKGSFFYQIELKRQNLSNWQTLGLYNFDQTTFSQNLLGPGVTNEYRIKLIYKRATDLTTLGALESAYSNAITASTKALPSIPSNFTASTDRCDKKVELR